MPDRHADELAENTRVLRRVARALEEEQRRRDEALGLANPEMLLTRWFRSHDPSVMRQARVEGRAEGRKWGEAEWRKEVE